MTTFDEHINRVRANRWLDDAEDESKWDGYWTWRTEHPDEFEKARALDDELGGYE